MKKNIKLFILTIISIVLLGGCGVKEQYDSETISKAKDITKSYIENNYKDVESIELEEPRQSPMGSMKIDGTVNGDIGFTVTFSEDLSINSVGKKSGFPEKKEECKDTSCEY